ATPAGLALSSVFGDSVWDTRNLISAAPELALTAGLLLTSIARPFHLITAGLVVAGLAIGAVKLLEPRYERPDYRAAAALVIDDGTASDPIAIVPAPTPGPLAAPDAALAYAGAPGRRLLRIGSA